MIKEVKNQKSLYYFAEIPAEKNIEDRLSGTFEITDTSNLDLLQLPVKISSDNYQYYLIKNLDILLVIRSICSYQKSSELKKRVLNMMVCIIASTFTHAQSNVLISDDDWTLTSSNGACNCATNFNNGSVTNFFDSGNNTNSYSSNENEVITLCPDASGSKMVAVFGTNADIL